MRDGNRVSGVLGTSTPTVDTCRVARTIKPSHWTPTLNNILLTKGSDPQYKGKILQNERSSKWESVEKKLTRLPRRKRRLHKRWIRQQNTIGYQQEVGSIA